MCPMGALFILWVKYGIKKATTFEEQIERLEKKDIIITNRETCKVFLARINYYRLSGYY